MSTDKTLADVRDGWPEYLMLRDTGLADDMGGLGQRIFTTAGAGYVKQKYVRADLAECRKLANVQPGGRVRLGDQARVTISDDLLSSMAYAIPGAVESTDKAKAVAARVVEIYLSAQPSPGGQDTLARLRDNLSKCRDGANAGRENHPSERNEGIFIGLGSALLLVEQALAARQPVGEPVAVVGADFDLFWIGSGPIAPLVERNGLRPGSKLYARPAQAVDHEVTDAMVDKAWNRFEAALHADDGDTPEDRVLSETIDQRDRYHEMADELAGHIARIIGVDIGEHSSANCPWQNAIEAAEEYKPAQAVDLGEMPDGWRLSKKATCYQLSHGNDIIGNLVGPDAEENAAIIARVLNSQAVGNG